MQTPFILTPSASKSLPFKIVDNIVTDFKIRTMSINFNTAGFVKEAGYGPDDYERRVNLLAEFMKIMARDYHVKIFNLQEMTSRYMRMEQIRNLLMKQLLTVSTAWTATNPFGRHADANMSLHLMTFYNANVFHLNSVTNCHFSYGDARTVGDDLCPEQSSKTTSNAMIMDMSLIVPKEDSEFHSEGVSVDNNVKYLNVNVHMPLRGCYKVKSMEKILKQIEEYPNIETYFVSVSGDMNLFGDESECNQIIDTMKKTGKTNAIPTENNVYQYETLFGNRLRTGTFIGMLYDLKNNMKLDINHETYKTWINGNTDEILKISGRKLQPLDWHLSRDQPWCETIKTQVVDMTDLRELKFDVPIIADDKEIPDPGNFIVVNHSIFTSKVK
jgi:hypothetical protein